MKEYANFGEIPLLFVDAKLLGGVEIIEALDYNGELIPMLGPRNSKAKFTYKSAEDLTKMLLLK